MMNGIELRIDKAGRVVLPKPVRERLGLREGTVLEMSETSNGVLLRRLDQAPSMIKKQGLWVHAGKIPPGFDVVQAVQDDREERNRKLAGL